MKTYWLYYYGKPIHCTRLPAGSSRTQVIEKCLRETRVCPYVCVDMGTTPFEHMCRIRASRVFCVLR